MKLCECGCGTPTSIITRNDTNRGWVKGEYKRFIKEHTLRPTHKPVKWWVNPITECWEWLLSIRPDGYGSYKENGKTLLAHRWLYQKIKKVTLPLYAELDHLCRVRHCVNPDHLEPVTRATNIRRGATPVINMDIARLLRADYAIGNTSEHKLARKYKISRGLVHNVLNGSTWKENKCSLEDIKMRPSLP